MLFALLNLAVQRFQSSIPLRFGARFLGEEVNAHGPKVGSAASLGRAAKDIFTPGNLKVNKTGSQDRCLKLCFQQSAGNSTGPEVNVPFGAFRHFLLDENVADL
jgi:hypothetical protein